MAPTAKQERTEGVLRREIQEERARALARAIEALEGAVEELARFDARPPPAVLPPRWRERRADLVAEAAERLWYVVIQREAIGVTRHEVLYDVLRIPAEVRYRMGPRRRTGT